MQYLALMLHEYEYEKSEGLAAELSLRPKEWVLEDIIQWKRNKYGGRASFVDFFRSHDFYVDIVATFPEGTGRVLDIGVGEGLTSLYLMTQGYDVVAIEPSDFLAANALALARHAELELDVHMVSAEHIELMKTAKFDVAVFHSSLHHCDDPVGALRKVREKLQPGGCIYLINEPILHCLKSKKAFYAELENVPEKHEHYGGNEHIYRHDEYVRMLREAGFREVCSEFSPALLRMPRISPDATKLHAFLVKAFYFCFRNTQVLSRLYKPLLDTMSLGPRIFKARV